MTEIEKRKDFTDWKTTKEVADKLNLSPSTLRAFVKNNRVELESLGLRYSEQRTGRAPPSIIWNVEMVKFAIRKIPSVGKEWKDSIKDEFMEKGIVMAQTSDINIIEQQWQMIGNLIQAKKQQDIKISSLTEEQHAMHKELDDHSKLLEKHEKLIQDDKQFDEIIKTIRDYIQDVYNARGKSIWAELHSVFHFSKLDRITVEKGKAIIKYIQEKYYFED